MKISIITVCYNSDKTIEKTIKSVLSQDYNDIEYIVIDGNSKDKTCNIIKKYLSKIDKFISESDKGMYYALNKGIRLAKGDIIGLLHSGDVYTNENVISEIMKIFTNEEIDSLYANVNYVNKNKIVRNYISPSNARKGFKKAIQPAHPTFFAKLDVYKNYGLFNTKFKIGSDYDILLRFLVKHNVSYYYLNKILINMDNGGVSNQSIKNIIKNNFEIYNSAKINGFPVSILTIVKKLISKYVKMKLL